MAPTAGSPARVTYLGALTPGSALRIRFGGLPRDVRFVGSTARGLALATRLGLRAEPLRTTVGEIRDAQGRCEFVRIWADLLRFCLELSDGRLSGDASARALSRHLDAAKTLNLVQKAVAEAVYPFFVLANAAVAESRGAGAPVVLLARGPFAKRLAAYACTLGAETATYPSLGAGPVASYARIALQRVIGRLRRRGAPGPAPATGSPAPAEVPLPAGGPFVARTYAGEFTTTLDARKRSQFHFFVRDGLPEDRALVFAFDNTFGGNEPVTAEMAAACRAAGIAFVAVTPGAAARGARPAWAPGAAYRRTRSALMRTLVGGWARSLLTLRPTPGLVLANLWYLAERYAWWRDLFGSVDVKVSVENDEFNRDRVPMRLALADAGGVSVAYQWSDIAYPVVELGSTADVMFAFGPAHRPVWEGTRSPIGRLVYGGYITDHAFPAVREDAAALRARMEAAGARYVVCYFDENSADDLLSPITNAASAEVYRVLLSELLADPTLGLVFKPKRPGTFRERLAAIAGLLDEALASGRCIVLGVGAWLTEEYPAQAAIAADLCVGHLWSRTAVLESALAGQRAVFLDPERIESFPEHEWGRGTVLFETPAEMFEALGAFRSSPEGSPAFGDLSEWVEDRDPYRDGNASLRMGRYVNDLLDALAAGADREAALGTADAAYRKRWGEEAVVTWR